MKRLRSSGAFFLECLILQGRPDTLRYHSLPFVPFGAHPPCQRRGAAAPSVVGSRGGIRNTPRCLLHTLWHNKVWAGFGAAAPMAVHILTIQMSFAREKKTFQQRLVFYKVMQCTIVHYAICPKGRTHPPLKRSPFPHKGRLKDCDVTFDTCATNADQILEIRERINALIKKKVRR